MEYFFFLILVIIVGVVMWQVIALQNRKGEMASRLSVIPGFYPSQEFIGTDGLRGIAVDELGKKLCLITRTGGEVTERILSYRNVLSVEIFEDGTSVTRSSRSSQAGGALLGGLVLGGVGAIIGGLSGKTETSDKVKRIDLRLTVNDMTMPLHDVAFLDFASTKSGGVYNLAMKNARHWHGIVEVLIKRADDEERTHDTRTQGSNQPKSSVADELAKLAALKSCGVLTTDEFLAQKARVLASDQ